MLKLNASFSKKVPVPGQDYSSKGYSAEISVELPDNLNQQQLQERIHNTFALVEASVEAEINGSNTQVPKQNAPIAPVATIPIQRPADGLPSQSSTKAPVGASAKQIKFLLDIARKGNVDIQTLLQSMGVSVPEDLNKKQCSALIDQLNGIRKAA